MPENNNSNVEINAPVLGQYSFEGVKPDYFLTRNIEVTVGGKIDFTFNNMKFLATKNHFSIKYISPIDITVNQEKEISRKTYHYAERMLMSTTHPEPELVKCSPTKSSQYVELKKTAYHLNIEVFD